MHIGCLANRSRPTNPVYFPTQPTDQRRTMYSVPKITTRKYSYETILLLVLNCTSRSIIILRRVELSTIILLFSIVWSV